MQSEWILYGTQGCHLCDEAERVIQALGIQCVNVDIIEEEQLMQHYALRIPVLKHTGRQNAELDWPFNLAQLESWLKQQTT